MSEENQTENTETQTSENTETTNYVSREDLENVSSQLEELRALNYQLMSQLNGKTTHTEVNEVNETTVPTDPKQIAKFIQAEAQKATQKITEESQKSIWDTKASKDFPLLETDQNFRKQVVAQMKDFVSSGEYSSTHPKLLFRAAELVASRASNKVSSKTSHNSVERETSIAPNSDSVAIQATKAKTKVQDNDPRVRFYKLFNPGATKEQIERFKTTQIESFESSRRGRRR